MVLVYCVANAKVNREMALYTELFLLSHVGVTNCTWNDLMKVQSSVRMPSPRLSSFTSRITRNNRKKLILIILEPSGWKINRSSYRLKFRERNRSVLSVRRYYGLLVIGKSVRQHCFFQIRFPLKCPKVSHDSRHLELKQFLCNFSQLWLLSYSLRQGIISRAWYVFKILCMFIKYELYVPVKKKTLFNVI